MSDVDDQQTAGRAWIRKRLEDFVSGSAAKVESIEFARNPKALGEFLIVCANGGRATAAIAFSTLEDLPTDVGEQTQMDALLHDVVSRLAASPAM
jgi:hypothetical protein